MVWGPWDLLAERVRESTHVIFYDLPVASCIERAKTRIKK